MLYKNTKVNVRSPDRDTDNFFIVTGVVKGDISFILVYLPRLRALNVYRFNDGKQFQASKGKKQKIHHINNYGRGLR